MGYAAIDIKKYPENSDRCFYCGVNLVPGPAQPKADMPRNTRTRDHVTPESRGGETRVWSCAGCNWEKGSLDLEEFRLVIAYRKGRLPAFNAYLFSGERI